MRIAPAFALLLSLPFAAALGNPIAIDGERRPAIMISEDVKVRVGADHSLVTGDFVFRQEKDDWPAQKDTHVLVYVPVFLPEKGCEAFENKYGLPIVSLKGSSFTAGNNNDLSQVDKPLAPKLPKGWGLHVYEARIPLRLIGRDFRIKVRYIQPHFPGRIAAYIPIMPPKDATRAKIIFQPASGYSLREPGFLAAFAPRQTRWEFTPKHRELFKLQLVKN